MALYIFLSVCRHSDQGGCSRFKSTNSQNQAPTAKIENQPSLAPAAIVTSAYQARSGDCNDFSAGIIPLAWSVIDIVTFMDHRELYIRTPLEAPLLNTVPVP